MIYIVELSYDEGSTKRLYVGTDAIKASLVATTLINNDNEEHHRQYWLPVKGVVTGPLGDPWISDDRTILLVYEYRDGWCHNG